MRRRVLDFLACPVCDGALELREPPSDPGTEIESGALECTAGHVFPVTAGLPRLLPDSHAETADAHSIKESFSREWEYFDYERDRTWGTSVADRREEFLRHVDLSAEQLRGKLVLDAGCGNGTLSQAIAGLGCEVVAADISRQVGEAHRHFAAGAVRPHFVQADLMRSPFRPATFDVVFCAGVLHHTPDTRATFETLLQTLAPGGTVFVWLYHHVPGRLLAFKSLLRRGLSRLPARAKSAVVLVALLPQAMVRQHIRTLLRRNHPRERLRWRERMVILLDSYTPRYRWEHTPAELASWFREHGFEDIALTEFGEWGFGVVARRPGERRAATDAGVTASAAA